jgi:hypothetical protein
MLCPLWRLCIRVNPPYLKFNDLKKIVTYLTISTIKEIEKLIVYKHKSTFTFKQWTSELFFNVLKNIDIHYLIVNVPRGTSKLKIIDMLWLIVILFCDIQLSLKYIHTGQTEMLCSHLGNAYSILSLFRNFKLLHFLNEHL